MSFQRAAFIKIMNLEAGELFNRINKRIVSLLEENSKFNFEKIINWDLNCEEDIKCMDSIKKSMENLTMISKYMEDKMQFKAIEKKHLYGTIDEISDREILEVAEQFSLAYLDEPT